mmetsp:Transcript_33895/g.44710  ORF Transcript_33895/g.44710 Transcript_33895/m.44710 type:complete len:899 (-) Transcript_33895:293-2989(-)
MSRATYDSMWREAMAELNEQVHIEDNTLDEEEGEDPDAKKEEPQEVKIEEAFQHFACLYIKYLQIMKKLELCYDAMVHPQKRIDVKMILELVIRRVLELKHALVKWNPPHPELAFQPPKQPAAFPWEYVNLDDILVDLKLPPETLEVPVPRYFIQDNSSVQHMRQKLVKGYMKLKFNVDQIMLEPYDEQIGGPGEMTIDQAIEIIQRNERGRQGKQRANLIKDHRERERQTRLYDGSSAMEMEPDIAATHVQKLFRGFNARRKAVRERDEELVFIGMKAANVSSTGDLEQELKLAYRKRKQDQTDNREAYEKALVEMKEVVREEEGPEMREEAREARTQWVTEMIQEDKFPDNLDEYYAKIHGPPPPEEKPDDKKEEKGKKGKGKKDKKEKKGGKKGKKKKEKVELPPEKPPALQGKTALTEAMVGSIGTYEDVWQERDESDNFAQKHDVELVKSKIRPDVQKEIESQVDEMLVMNLKKIKLQVAKASSDKKKKGKKGKKKGKKKGGKKGKKGKKGKTKALPGEKISELKTMDHDHMLCILVENKIINNYRPKHVHDLVGDFNYLGSVHHSSDTKGGANPSDSWFPQDPSMAQLRQNITEYCILPNGSAEIKKKVNWDVCPNIKSILFYGPSGSGKTLMAEAVANELGALLINISPSRVDNLFPGKSGPTKLIHMIFTVAKVKAFAPVVIYIDDCHKMFATTSKKKKGKSGDELPTSRFKKDISTYKNLGLSTEDRVIIIGNTSSPDAADMKDLKSFFDKFLYFPYPDYASRLMLWKYFVEERLTGNTDIPVNTVLGSMDFSTLSHISDGYSAGAIYRTVKNVMTERRVVRLGDRPLGENEFIAALARQSAMSKEENTKFREFSSKITGLQQRKDEVAGKEDTGKKKKGKGKKGKKKK